MLPSSNEKIRIAIEGNPGVGKSTLWKLLCQGHYSETRNRSSEVNEETLSPEKIKRLFM